MPSLTATTLRDTALATWLRPLNLKFTCDDEISDVLGVLRDELTSVCE